MLAVTEGFILEENNMALKVSVSQRGIMPGYSREFPEKIIGEGVHRLAPS